VSQLIRDRDGRFETPLYTVGEAARFLGVPVSTFSTWVRGYRRTPEGRSVVVGEPIVTSVAAGRRMAEIPFIGLAEGMVVAAFRRTGVSMQKVRKALTMLEQQMGVEHALASEALFTDGVTVFYDYAGRERDEDLCGLTEVISGQRVFVSVVREYLKRIRYARDHWAERLVLPITQGAVIEVDPKRAFGQPVFMRGGARLEDVLQRFLAGDRLRDLSEDFGVPVEDIEDVIRGTHQAAA